ncbi:sialate O-acetylesterase [Microbacterium sp. Leaf179]|uniref:sialate O-acetylesterase n=1 Tax=Microbacterium sp. Leaf179 TaxID=1736288 RepID=UPI0006FE1CF9|nr:sialate O-acetylesterase [Microbacterium sp. Leaf179]KQR86825.1 hypothetical protein ASF96_10960 [Microbacterium sp. Leaf179]
MATGRYDENGFYSYGEDDLADPGQGFSELLNKSTEGVKQAVPTLVHNRVKVELNDDATIRDASAERFEQLVAQSGDRLLRRDVSEAFGIRTEKGAPVAQFTDSSATLAGDVRLTGATVRPGLGLAVGVGERAPIWVDPTNGDIHMAGMIIRAGSGFRIADAGEREIFSAGGSSAGSPVRRVVPLFVAGQSNADGRGQPYSVELDPADDRCFMWDYTSQGLKVATVPLPSRANNSRAGLSPAHVMAREILTNEPAGTVVVIVNTAIGGSGLVALPSNSTAGRWLWGASGSRAPGAITIMKSALDAIAQAFPGVKVEMPRGLWAQGEADTDGPAYAPALKEVLTQMSNGIGFPSMTWVLTGIVPEYIKNNPSRAAIREAHMDLPRTMLRTAYADGIPGGGGSYEIDDLVHYSRQGVIALGRAAYAAYKRATVNTASSVPVPPIEVTATAQGVSWTPPLCRVTAYTVEKSTDNGATWTAVPRPLPAADQYQPAGKVLEPYTAITGPALVRIATTNDVGTSAYTTPIRTPGA